MATNGFQATSLKAASSHSGSQTVFSRINASAAPPILDTALKVVWGVGDTAGPSQRHTHRRHPTDVRPARTSAISRHHQTNRCPDAPTGRLTRQVPRRGPCRGRPAEPSETARPVRPSTRETPGQVPEDQAQRLRTARSTPTGNRNRLTGVRI